MLGAPDFTHASLAEQLDQLVAAKLACLANLSPHPVDHYRRHNGDHRADVVRAVEGGDFRERRHVNPAKVRHADRQRIHRCSDQRGDEGLAGVLGAIIA